jgi:3-hydroxyisobutyrate dehydrogenase
MQANVGVIGLGAMGAPMAERLHKARVLRSAWNRTRERVAKWAAALGVPLAADPADLAAQCEVIILSVSREPDLMQVIEQMLKGLRAGTIVLDTSTVSSSGARRASDYLAERKVAFLDAPVSGGVEGARNGTLVMMVGGDPAVLDKVRPVLALISRKVEHMGPAGSGQATKAVNQIMVAGIAQGVCEALAFGRRMGLDLGKVIEITAGGAAANWFLDHRGPTMIRDRFAPGFRVSLHHKDLGICREMVLGAQGHSRLPVVEMTLRHYERLMADGHGDEDISALYRIKRAALDA